MTAPETNSAAIRWFGVRAEYERAGPVKLVFRTIWAVAKGLPTLWILTDDLEPKRFCDVVVFRRDNGSPVAKFSHAYLGDGARHVEDLLTRLATDHVFDFCRELGIGIEAVVGAGDDRDFDASAVWVSLSKHDRSP